jgi:RNA polymerase sigma-70 factor, ECF subfamily
MNSPAQSVSQSELIARAQRGEEPAFEALFNMYKRRVYCLCLRMTRNPDQAEDLSQDAFLQLFRRIPTFRGESTFSTWLHRLVVNVVLMHLRKKHLSQVPLDEGPSSSQERPVRHEYGREDPRLAGTIDRISIAQALSQLPLGYRTTFLFHDLHGFEHYEIAQFRNCSVGNSKSQLHKARRRLRGLLTARRSQGRSSVKRKTSLHAFGATRQPAFINTLAMLDGA